MSSLTKKRLQFWLTWSAANGLSIGTLAWVAALIADSDRKSMIPVYALLYSLLSVFVGTGAVAGVQQFFLIGLGWRARWWWLASCGGWILAVIAALCTVDAVANSPFLGPLLREGRFLLGVWVFGFVIGLVQILACIELRERLLVFPFASGFGLLGASLLFSLVARQFELNPFYIYCLSLLAGTVYGGVTGIAVILRIDERSGAIAGGISGGR